MNVERAGKELWKVHPLLAVLALDLNIDCVFFYFCKNMLFFHQNSAFFTIAGNSIFQYSANIIFIKHTDIIFSINLMECFLALFFQRFNFSIFYFNYNTDIQIINPDQNITETISGFFV